MMWCAVGCAALAACVSRADAPADWMAGIEDTRGLAELSIPGTHDAGARVEPYAGIAKTQDLTIAEQLAAGVRYFDVRCRHFQDGFLIFHGPIDQDQTFAQVLATMYAFLDEHPDEALIVSVMEESTPYQVTRSFEATFADYVAGAPDRWAMAATLPVLGAVRGRLVLLRRFAATAAPLGLDATAWPDNSSFSIDNAASLRIQDAYMVSDDDVKWTAITGLLDEARTGSADTLYLDYTSGYQMIDGLPNIPSVSDEINLRLDVLLAEPGKLRARLGVLVMDHVTAARVQAVISTNAR
ncbi:MAG: phosphatidylinositol-specific phospholipase C [Kofleriaceae bacterium]